MWSQTREEGKIRYFERFTDPLTEKSKTVSVTLSGKDTASNRKRAAEALALKIEQASPAISNDKTTLDTLFKAYMAYQEKTVKKSTSVRNKRTLSHLLDLFGHDAIVNNLTAQYIKDTLLAHDYAPGTMNEYIRRFKAMISWGYENDYCDNTDLLKKLKCFKDVPHREKIKDKYLEPSELKKLLDYMKNTNKMQWYYLTLFLALSGLRIGEATALECSDIDNMYIHVTKSYDVVNHIITTTKTVTSTRDVYIQPELQAMLKEYRLWSRQHQMQAGIRTTHLFYHDSGDYLSYGAYNKYLREVSESVLCRKIIPHTLRHTHASILMSNGVDIDTISRRLGHENSTITREIYLHVMEKLVASDNEQIKGVKSL